MFLTEQLMRGAMRSGLPPSPRLVLMVMGSHADQYGRCWPSQSLLADETGLSVRTVRDSLGALESAGWLTVQTRGNSVKSSTRYRLNVARLLAETPAATAAVEKLSTANTAGQLRQILPVTPAATAAQPSHEPDHLNHADQLRQPLPQSAGNPDDDDFFFDEEPEPEPWEDHYQEWVESRRRSRSR